MLRRLRVYRIIRAALVIAAVAFRYWRLQRRERLARKPTPAEWDRAHARTGRALYRLATGLGGAFVKLGQVLGSRTDVS